MKIWRKRCSTFACLVVVCKVLNGTVQILSLCAKVLRNMCSTFACPVAVCKELRDISDLVTMCDNLKRESQQLSQQLISIDNLNR